MVALFFNSDLDSGQSSHGTGQRTPFGGRGWLDFSDEYECTQQLNRDRESIAKVLALRESFFRFASPFDLTRFPDEDVILLLADRLVSGRFEWGPGEAPRVPFGEAAASAEPTVAEEEEEAPPESEAPPPPVEEETAWIKFKVIDEDSGEPVKGVTLHVKTPDGKIKQVRTGPDGMAEISGIQPGSCSIERIVDADALEITAVE